MADLGTIARLAGPALASSRAFTVDRLLTPTNINPGLERSAGFIRGLQNVNACGCGFETIQPTGIRKDTTQGRTTAPCLRMDWATRIPIRWPVKGGVENTLKIWVNQPVVYAAAPPRIVMLKEDTIGVISDQTAEAAASSGWVLVGPISVTPTVSGAVTVYLENRSMGNREEAFCLWDDLEVSPQVNTGDFSVWQYSTPFLALGGAGSAGGTSGGSWISVI